MRTPPESVAVGDRLSQEEIEEAFDTGFGYRISGINPRRDAHENQYVLVFATEDGPYDDAVTSGQFTYIGEGLEGDQSTTSPGNSVLIDAITADIPVHFFYQRSGTHTWEYQGLVDVLEYEFQTQDGRDVIVFTMEHRTETAVGGADSADELSWLDAMRRELERYQDQTGNTTVTLDDLYAFAEHRLSARFPDNDHVRAKIRQQLQYLRDQGEIEFLDDQGTYRITSGDAVQQAHEELQVDLESDPQLNDETEEYTEQRRRARSQAFAERVKEVYDYTCAICGSSRKTPTGQPEVEAAHIYPKREGGADDVRNGLALCTLHHWAFDTGWLALTDDYEILVAEAPDREGYHEFKQFEGDTIRLPADDDANPHPIFLQAHRELYGF